MLGFSSRKIVAATALTAVMAASAVPAQAFQESDLVGARGAGAETQMLSRGYELHHTSQSNDSSYTYWWRDRDNQCVRLATSNGRVAAIRSVDASDCGHRGRGGNNGAAAAAVAAAAILGVAALSHRSHHRNDQSYDANNLAEFERGHRDGLYGHSYSNYSRSDRYSDGYRSGVEERDYQSSYRGNSYGRGGYAAQQQVSDLRFRPRAEGQNEIVRRGFRLVGDVRPAGGGHHFLYWNGQTRQCVTMDTRDGQVVYVDEVRASTCN
jgi:hypothetical protein